MRLTEKAYLHVIHLIEIGRQRSLWAVFRASVAERFGPKSYIDTERRATLRDSPLDPTDAVKQLTDAIDKATAQAKRSEDVGLRAIAIAEAEIDRERLIEAEYASATTWIVARLRRDSWVKTLLLMVITVVVTAVLTHFGYPAIKGAGP